MEIESIWRTAPEALCDFVRSVRVKSSKVEGGGEVGRREAGFVALLDGTERRPEGVIAGLSALCRVVEVAAGLFVGSGGGIKQVGHARTAFLS